VVEKEVVYQSILVTSRGFPDLATLAIVFLGLADCSTPSCWAGADEEVDHISIDATAKRMAKTVTGAATGCRLERHVRGRAGT
jgi:hypothetical protein